MESLQTVSLDRLKESPLNPRTHFDDKKLAELADSIRGVGIIEPIVARPSKTNGHFEIIAGSRRFRAAKLAELADVPVIVRDIDDTKALELMVIENNQREDVNALEEAEGYSRLLKTGKEYKLELLAQKIGRSTKYVYDRLKLLELVPEAKKLMLAGTITAGHAILLARRKPEQQRSAIDFNNRHVWSNEAYLSNPQIFDEEEDDTPKVCSVRELEAWLDEHCAFDKKAPVDPILFPETAVTLKAAAETKEKVVLITYHHFTQPEAKEGLGNERIYHGASWRRADGSSKEYKPCDKSVTGVVVAGFGRGTAFKVCVNKNCDVHWAKEKRAKKREASASSSGGGANERWRAEQERYRKLQEERERKQKEWAAVVSKLRPVCLEKIAAAPFGLIAEIAYRHNHLRGALKHVAKPKTIDDLARLLAVSIVINELDEWEAWKTFPPRAKRLGIDVAEFMPKEKPQTSGKGAAAVDSKKTTKAPKKKKK